MKPKQPHGPPMTLGNVRDNVQRLIASCLNDACRHTALIATMQPKHPPVPPMTLGNMCEVGVQNLIVSCLNDARPAHGADRCVQHRSAIV
jgi:hypothetical protein